MGFYVVMQRRYELRRKDPDRLTEEVYAPKANSSTHRLHSGSRPTRCRVAATAAADSVVQVRAARSSGSAADCIYVRTIDRFAGTASPLTHLQDAAPENHCERQGLRKLDHHQLPWACGP